MNKILKIFVFAAIFVMAISVACSSTPTPPPVPTEIPTQIPTQTALPTYTPMPTYTPYPTATHASVPTQKPTSVPDTNNLYADIPSPSGIEPMECPNTDYPEGASKAECYSLDGKGLGIIYFDGYNEIWGIAAAWFSEDNVAYTAGEFLAWAGMTHGWNGDDIVGAINAIKEPDTWYTYGSVKSKITVEEGKIALILKPIN